MSSHESTTILVYSDDRTTREKVRLAIGRRPAADLPHVEFVEVATPAAAMKKLASGGIDVAILDGEAVPSGGMGLARTMKDEIYQAPPVLVLIGRPDDAWLATWSRAEATVCYPLNPIEIATKVADLIRRRIGVAS